MLKRIDHDNRALTVAEAIEALPLHLADDWMSACSYELDAGTMHDGEDAEEYDERSDGLRTAFWVAVRSALERLAPVTIVPTPDED